jgi:lambda repressor-like predicted transcriptional regulator
MKELYCKAKMDVIDFSVEDVIATSIETDPTIIWPTVDDNTTDVLDPIP